MVNMLFTGMKLLVANVLSPEQKFNQDHFRAMTAPESSKENTNANGESAKTKW
jgi:hypothetical protein